MCDGLTAFVDKSDVFNVCAITVVHFMPLAMNNYGVAVLSHNSLAGIFAWGLEDGDPSDTVLP